MSRKEILIVNAVCMNRSNTAVDVVLARFRGDVPMLADGSENPGYDGRTVKLPPHLFKGDIPFNGEALAVEFEERFLTDAGPKYRALRNAKISVIVQGTTPVAAAAAEEPPHPAEAAEPQQDAAVAQAFEEHRDATIAQLKEDMNPTEEIPF